MKNKGGKNAIYGGAAGAIASVMTQPFDVIKTNMISKDVARVVRNPIFVAREVIKNHGFRGLYFGSFPSLIRVVPAAGLYFYLIHKFRDVTACRINKDGIISNVTHTQNFFIGVGSRAISAFTSNPQFIVKTQFEYLNVGKGSIGSGGIIKSKKVTTIQLLKDLFLKKQIFRGAFSSVMRDAPYAGVMYTLMQTFLKLFMKISGVHDVARWTFPSSLLASYLSVSIFHPFDVIRTRIQLNTDTRFNLIEDLRKIYLEDGITGYWRGYLMRVSKKALASSICWTLFEYFLKWTNNRKNK